jgi:DNA-binding NarL/FixJ family response regulator
MKQDPDSRLRLVLADDQRLVRAGLRRILESEPDLDVVAEATDGHEAVEAVTRHQPDVVLMDIRMPRLDGIAATKQLLRAHPGGRVLILTTYDQDEYVYDALRAGASGFMLKDAQPEQLIDAVRVIAAGAALLAPTVTKRLIAEFTARPSPLTEPRLDRLTPREREVFILLAQGLSNGEIAARLFLGEATIKTHLTAILAKTSCRDRVQAVVLAYQSGLVTPHNT